ncbi:MAG: hypothetical protein PHT36_01040 [Patescibacteria group bacterium]|nr:hypothetical protein [Patescibacteria group bacterium]
MGKTVKDSSIQAVYEGLMRAVESRGLDREEAEKVFEGAIEEIRSDLSLCSLAIESVVWGDHLERRSSRHELDLGRFLESGGLSSETMVRVVYRHLQMEMSDQLHLLHDGRPIFQDFVHAQ